MKIIIIGTGSMAKHYLAVLTKFDIDVVCIGRSKESVDSVRSDYPGYTYVEGGIENNIVAKSFFSELDVCIVCTPVECLISHVKICIQYGVRKILCEKPLSISLGPLNLLCDYISSTDAEVYIAYNRRFYNIVSTMKERLLSESITSVRVEVTERSWLIDLSKFDGSVLSRWFFANTTHVLDLARYICGRISIEHVQCSKPSIWHEWTVCNAIGTINAVPLNIYGDWNASGGWALTVNSDKACYTLKPLEKLTITYRDGSPTEVFTEESPFKPGLHIMMKEFYKGDYSKFDKLSDYQYHYEQYERFYGK